VIVGTLSVSADLGEGLACGVALPRRSVGRPRAETSRAPAGERRGARGWSDPDAECHRRAGAQSGRKIDDIARLTEQYGARADDWSKISTRVRDVEGTKISVRWYENVRTRQRVEFKSPWDH
jgi:hypothetical protein